MENEAFAPKEQMRPAKVQTSTEPAHTPSLIRAFVSHLNIL